MNNPEKSDPVFGTHRALLLTPRIDPSVGIDPQYRLDAERDIQETLFSYATFYDARDIESLVDIFTDDALFVDITGTYRGRDEIGAHFKDLTSGMTNALHMTLNTVTRLDSIDRARSGSFLYAIGAREGGSTRGTTGTYSDVLVREPDGRWRISERLIAVNMSFALGDSSPQGASDALSHLNKPRD
jgi:uncharacterized protein (TIGR02246 family)